MEIKMPHTLKMFAALKMLAIECHTVQKDGLQVMDALTLGSAIAKPENLEIIREGFNFAAIKQEVATAGVGDWFAVLGAAVTEVQDALQKVQA